MSNVGSQVLFLGELPFWLKISQSILDAPAASVKICRAPSLNDAVRRLDSEQWQALLLDLSHPSAQELLAARELDDGLGSVPLVTLISIDDRQFQEAAAAAGASASLFLEDINVAS